MSTVTMERVSLRVADGTSMHAHVARPPSGATNTPGILVFQEAFGVNDHIRDIARRFADLGFTAIAPELYHRTGDGFTAAYGDMATVRPASDALTLDTLKADGRAAYDWLINEAKCDAKKIASIGFCQGGRTSYVTNSHVPLAAAVSFYGGRIQNTLELVGTQHAPIMMFWGGQDKGILPEHRRAVEDALTAADKPNAQIVFSYAEHGFFCDARPSYNADAARQAWALVLEFFRTRGVL